MIDSDDERAEAVLAVLCEAHNLACANLVRALLNAFVGLLVLCIVALVDRGFIDVLGFVQMLSRNSYEALWAAKWILAIGSSLYVFFALGHAYVSWQHTREARYLWKWVDHV